MAFNRQLTALRDCVARGSDGHGGNGNGKKGGLSPHLAIREVLLRASPKVEDSAAHGAVVTAEAVR